MEPIPPLSKPARDLLVEIARCRIAENCLVSGILDHPCSKVVAHQWSNRPPADKPERWKDEHHMPEPWYGHLERAPILFLSSNPSIGKPPSVFPGPLPPPTRNGHPLQTRVGRAATYAWEEEHLERWYEDAFDFRIVNGTKGLKADGVPKDATPYWSGVKARAKELIPYREVRPGIDYALTEVVHCKSQSEDGVPDALSYCARKYLNRVLKASGATLIMVMGAHAREAVASLLSMGPDLHLEGPIPLGDRDRYFAFLPHTNAHEPRTLANCFRPEEIVKLRQLVADACAGKPPTLPRYERPSGPVVSDAPPVQSPQEEAAPKPNGCLGLLALVIFSLGIIYFGYWTYGKVSPGPAPVQETKPIPSPKCPKCGAPVKATNNYCTNCGTKVEPTK